MPISRRTFAKAVTAAVALPGTDGLVGDEPKSSASATEPDPLRAEVAAWLETIRLRYPDQRMTPEVMKSVAADVLGDILHCRRVSSFPLKNSDAPAFVMTVFPN